MYTVPERAANTDDGANSVELVPAAEMPPVAESDRLGSMGLFRRPSTMTQDRPCSDQVEASVRRTVDGLVAWLQTVPGLDATEPTPITIDGRPGRRST